MGLCLWVLIYLWLVLICTFTSFDYLASYDSDQIHHLHSISCYMRSFNCLNCMKLLLCHALCANRKFLGAVKLSLLLSQLFVLLSSFHISSAMLYIRNVSSMAWHMFLLLITFNAFCRYLIFQQVFMWCSESECASQLCYHYDGNSYSQGVNVTQHPQLCR